MTLCLFSQKKNVPLSGSLMKKGHTALKLPKSLISKIQMMPCVDFTYWLQLFVGRKEFQLCVGCCSATQDAGAKHDKLTPSFPLSNRCPRVTLLESPTWTVRANGPVSSFVQAGALTKCKLKQEGKKNCFFEHRTPVQQRAKWEEERTIWNSLHRWEMLFSFLPRPDPGKAPVWCNRHTAGGAGGHTAEEMSTATLRRGWNHQHINMFWNGRVFRWEM